jgi:hypothetical protein
MLWIFRRRRAGENMSQTLSAVAAQIKAEELIPKTS